MMKIKFRTLVEAYGTQQEAADFLEISLATLKRWMADKKKIKMHVYEKLLNKVKKSL